MQEKYLKNGRSNMEYNIQLAEEFDETEKTIYIAHIYYGGRNYIDDLL